MEVGPCRNPNCKSYGTVHPNCKCYGGGNGYAHGGTVCDVKSAHMPGCEYFADGGQVTAEPHENPSVTLDNTAAHHGLLGILKDTGKARFNHFEKSHHKMLDKARDHVVQGNHDKAVDTLVDTPLTGIASRGRAESVMKRLGSELATKEVDPVAFRASSDYLHSSIKGDESVKTHMKTFFDNQKSSDRLNPNKDHRDELSGLLKKIQEEPHSLLDVGGHIGHYLPDHASAIGALSARAVDYLNTMRPKVKQNSPLDMPIEPDASVMDQFHRQVDNAQNPLLIMQHVREGNLLPSDIKTVQTIYPTLYKSLQEKASESLIEAKTKQKEIPYKQAVSLGLLLGQPLETSMTTFGMQAIMQANAGAQAAQESQGPKQKSQSRPTAAQIKQIDKVDNLYATPDQKRLMDQKS